MFRKLAAVVAVLMYLATVISPVVAAPAPTARTAGSSTAAAQPVAVPDVSAPSGLPASETDETKVPHYFGPYSNWANSPQVLANAVVTLSLGTTTPVTFGNSLVGRANATDYAVGPGSLGPVFVVLTGSALPGGKLNAFQTWNQADPGSSPTPSAGGLFQAYLLRPTGKVNEYTVVYESGQLTVPALADPAVSEMATFPVTPAVAVQAGDVIGFYGQGIPVDTGITVGQDAFSYPATADPTLASNVAPAAGATIALGVDPGFPLFTTQDRSYSFAASVTPTVVDPGTGATATPVVDPKTGAISSIVVTDPGAGYVNAPTVQIASPGVTPTSAATATAQISTGVVNGITVNEPGFGFTSPSVVITGGNPAPGFGATAVASGGVDNVTLSSGGSGYTTQPLVAFTAPNLPGSVQATGIATMDAGGHVIAVDVVDAGSGYTSAPTVTIKDAGQTPLQDPAVAAATIGIAEVVVTSGGKGYDSAPAVDISDLGGTASVPATATAAVAVKGAVTGITVTNHGSGYLTPGIRKFVDSLAGLGPAGANDLGNYIPVAVPDTTTYPGADYYEIAVVQYRQQFHKDLPPTLLRGYVQISTSVVPGAQVPLSNANLDPSLPATPITGFTGVDKPSYLGPTIVASKDRPVRILFRNLLPTGVAGELFLPVDTTLMGAGMGPGGVALDANGVPISDQGFGSVLDEVRNPMCGVDKMDCYAENRATLHLHGGITPWISDGTPHQWTTPVGEDTAYPQGVSVSNVPDMPDPGPGAMTFFYTNQQSARLMFYHDHAWGITRLNVYAGEAAGYVLTDATEQALIAAGGALDGLGIGTPLVIQDKTFVPDTIHQTDPTWDSGRWGGTGSLWTPHVYMPAQNPGDPSGMSSYGRWMYGPWFWPPAKDAKYGTIANPYFDPSCSLDDPATWQYQVDPFCEPALIPGTPNISVGMEAFNDTPIVNGTAYPTTTVDPKAYRFRILNAANDRFWNLSWYVADPTTGTLSEVALKPAEVEAALTDTSVFPTPDTTKSPAGPNWVQIGTEGGFLPTPVTIPAQPITWITDPTRFDVGNVDKHGLLLAPAERADVVVDFSAYRGKTLILYNDAPAAFPARVACYDYYTGNADLTPACAPSTLPGYGPNTRTIMQVKVSSAAPAVAWDRPNTTADRMGALVAAFGHKTDKSGVFESGSDPIVVGQAAYNQAYGTTFAGGGWCSSPQKPSVKCDGYARIQEGSQPTDLFKFDTLSGNQLAIPFEPKGMHDEMNSASFDEYGRMTANLGLEAPGATPLLQNIILYPYVNPATEILDSSGMPSALDVTPISSAADGTQIWKITHNGVDTHPIHFHLYDVQVINRVTWDNIIIPPDANELGWKDTVRISPLEDTIVAVRPIVPSIPFGVPDSRRPLNPMMPIGAKGAQNGPNGTQAGFNNTDTLGNPIAPIVNEVVDFNWEYVFHCHILSHEEMDMMRPVTVFVPSAKPDAPVQLPTTAGSVVLHWIDGTPVDYTNPATWGSPKQEIRFDIYRADTGGAPAVWPINYAKVGSALANATTWHDTAGVGGRLYSYVIVAFNEGGTSDASNVETAVFGLDVTASSHTITYGDPAPSITFTYAPTTPAPDQGPVCTTAYVQGDPVGVYATSCAGIPTPDSTYKTSIVYFPGTLTVVPKPLTVTGPNTGIVYGDPVPALTPAYDGLVPPDAAPATTPATCTTTYTQGSPVGTYPVTCSGAADPNYSFAYTAGSITVGQAPVAVTAPSFSLTYGDAVPSVMTPAYAPAITPATTPDVCTTTYTQGSPVGTYPVTCSGAADPNYSFAYTAGSITVGQAALLITASSETMVYGGTVPAITPIYLGLMGTDLAPVNPPICYTNATSASSVGSYSSYCPGASDPNYSISSAWGTVTVTPAPQVITFNPLSNGTWGDPAFNVSATADSGLDVSFTSGTPATCNVSGTLVAYASTGLCTLVASQAGDLNHLAAAPVSQSFTILKATSVAVVSSPFDPTKVGAPAIFNVSVSAAVAAAGTPGGSVQLRVGGVNVGAPVALDAGGSAVISASSLAVGTSSVTVVYGGSTLFLGATSPALSHTVVTRLSTTTAVTSSANPSYLGQSVTFTATVTPQNASLGVAPSGTVQFTLDGNNLGTPVTLNVNGVATISTTGITVGNHAIRARYNADANYTTSRSPSLTQTVNRMATTTTLSLVTPVSRQTTIVYTATVTPAAANLGAPSGVVRFYRGGTQIGSATLVNGVATLNYFNSGLTARTYSMTARFIASGAFLGSTSAAVSQQILP